MTTAVLESPPVQRLTAVGPPLDAQLGWGFLAAWALAYALGEAMGLGALGLIVSRSQEAGPGARVVLALAAGALEGLIVGSLLGLVLRAVRPQLRLGAWIAATIAGAVVGWTLGSMLSLLMHRQPAVGWVAIGWVMAGAMLLGLCAGPILALFQQRVLRDLGVSAVPWMTANALGWSIAMPLVFLAADSPWTTGRVVVGGLAMLGLAGALVGLPTGMALIWSQRGTRGVAA